MQTPQSAIELLEEIQRLMHLKGENPFKVRAFEKAAALLAGRDDLLARAKAGTLTELPGIGKGIAEVLTDFLVRGRTPQLDELKASLPEGLLELTEIPGLGPKKAMQLIEELGIKSIGELEYACRENRLLKLKGFGEKAQHKVAEGIAFFNAHRGQQRLVDAFPAAEEAIRALVEAADGRRVCETGELRRRMEVLGALEFLVETPRVHAADFAGFRARLEKCATDLHELRSKGLPVRLHFAEEAAFGYELARTTSAAAHWDAIGAPKAFEAATEGEFYARLDLPVIPPEMRETGEEVALARSGGLDRVLDWNGIRGVFHNHTTRSDGTASLEDMVIAAKREGYSYIGISDHSQSAFYAQGMREEAILEQEREVREVQERHPEIRIFWGVESDILADGALDYSPKVLERFDFVVASIHSRFQMDRETMTHRILEAIRNPYTRFLGHVTGRLLLGRRGYDLDMEKIIAEAARREVAIEINANPARLDIDWRWGAELRKRGTQVSVNPDAHDTQGLADTRYGIAVARKALLPAAQVVNSRSLEEVEKWLARK